MPPNTLNSAEAIALDGEKAFLEGFKIIASALPWTPFGMLTQYLTDKTERDSPPTGKFVEIDGVRLHYLEHGTGILVVFLHGNGTMAYDFEVSSLLGLAAKKYHVLAFDRPGYGYSERPLGQAWTSKEQAHLLFKALQAVGIEPAVIVGHSWGTMVATSLALEHPECVRSLVLLSGYYYPTPRVDVLMLSPPLISGFSDIIRPTIVTQRWNAEFPVWMTLRPSQILASAVETALMTLEAFWLAQRYHELAMPVVIMAGTDDMRVPTKMHSERLHDHIPHSKLVLVPGVGHMIHHAVPGQVLSAIDVAAKQMS